ncbi:MAG: sigma-54-dependent Fis family transcriptional regulator [Mailhella sp.]|nr:sigma-54-dependent Fis family transcriptional regulator [Mailhella sp.]
MKTYLTPPPGAVSEKCREAARQIMLAAQRYGTEDFWKSMDAALRTVFRFDHAIYMQTGAGDARQYVIWPPYHGASSFVCPVNEEQNVMAFNSYHDTLVRICDRHDYATVTLSVLSRYMKEAHTDAFSLLFLRKVVSEDCIGLFGLVSFRKDAYGESDAAAAFELLDAFRYIWRKFGRSSSTLRMTSHNQNYFNLVGLPGMQRVLKLLYKVGREDVPVLLLGETGVGKEGVADLIYRGSGRWQRPFIKINCGGIPHTLIESKLFGYVKGAFTGADKDTPGCFELADTGVLFLDEIGELPLEEQAHLLRALQEGVIERVGSSVEKPVNVRIIAATNRNLVEMVDHREFREDLLYRLGVFPIYIPALRERPADIPVLLDFFILQQARRRGFVVPPKLTPAELEKLCAYAWPGNIREMKNAVTRSMLIWNGSEGTPFSVEVGRSLFGGQSSAAPRSKPGAEIFPAGESLRLEDVEKRHIERVLALANGRINGRGGAAEMLDINPSTLRSRMAKLGIIR